MSVRRRLWRRRLEKELSRFPVVAITGSRQVGKTTLAKSLRRDAVYVDLELPSGLRQLAEPEMFLRGHADRLVILDEIQRAPELFPLLRGLVDEDRRPGRFLVLGSAAPSLLAQSSESLAGRISYVELPPLGLHEIMQHGAVSTRRMERLWVRGGYPASYLAKSSGDSLAWRQSFIRTYVERDLPQLGVHVPSGKLRDFWSMLAHVHGQTWNAAGVAGSLGVTGPTTARWLSLLADACLVRTLPPFHANLKKRLVKSPKIYLRDSGTLHALLGIGSRDELFGHPSAGPSFEGFVVEQIDALRPPGTSMHFHRTRAGSEIDVVLTRRRGPPIGIEIKMSDRPSLSRGVHEAIRDLGLARVLVVVPRGPRAPLGERIEVVSITDLAAEPTLLA